MTTTTTCAPTEFFQDATHYDKTDRNGPKIFVGEWATREGAPTPNFDAALGDAAWMTGMERNSDIIVMASYAPLFVNVNPGGMQWESDLIGYDAMKSYGSPSYYAQVMFARYLGDHTLGSKLEGAGPKLFYSITRQLGEEAALPEAGQCIVQPAAGSDRSARRKAGRHGASSSASTRVHTQATNTIDNPERIVPVDSTLNNVSNHFSHTLPGYSIQVIQFDEK